MKKLFLYILTAGVFAACAPNEPDKPDMGRLANFDDVEFAAVVSTDPATLYRVSLQTVTPDVIPIWNISGRQVIGDYIYDALSAGTYTVQAVGVMNRAGVSMGATPKDLTFTVTAGSAVPGSPAYLLMNGPWIWDSTKQGHIGNGPANETNGPVWWNAGPNEQANNGMYDDVMRFNGDGSYVLEANGSVGCNERAALAFAGISPQPAGTFAADWTPPADPMMWNLAGGNKLSFTNGGFPSYVLPGWDGLTYTIKELTETTLWIYAPNSADNNNNFYFRFVHPAE